MLDKLLLQHFGPDPLFLLCDKVTDALGITGALEAKLLGLAAAVGLETQMIRYVIILLLNIPLGFVLAALRPAPAFVKHLMSVLVSFWICVMVFDPYQWAFGLGFVLIAYALLLVLPRSLVPGAMFVWSFGFMIVSHIYRAHIDWLGYHLDFTGPQMILTLKLAALGFSYGDGGRQDQSKLNEYQRGHALRAVPGPLEYLGFCYFFPSFAAGPTLDMADYQRYVDGSMFKDANLNGRSPSTLMPTLSKFVETLFWAAAHLVALIYFPVSALMAHVAAHPGLTPRLFALLYLVPTGERTKYYFGWNLAEAGFIASGIAYEFDAKTRAVTHSRYRNVTWYLVELAENVRSIAIYWNATVGTWMRNYVYVRAPRWLEPTLATFMVSAFWHGVYPGYYIAFLVFGLMTIAGRSSRRLVRPTVIRMGAVPKKIYDIVGTVTSVWFLSAGSASFLLLDWGRIVQVFGPMYFAPYLILIVFTVVIELLGALRILRPEQSEKRASKAE